MRRLFLFSARYPYVGAENFIEDEILYLSVCFDEIVIIPYKSTSQGVRSVPDNCRLETPMVGGTMDLVIKALFCPRAIGELLKDLFGNKVYLSVKRLKVWMTAYAATNSILNSKIVRHIEKELRKEDVCYFYWGKWSNVLASFWAGKAHFVSRFHGQWDLWEEEYDNYAPLRKKIANALDSAVFISEKGEKYFHERYPECNTHLFRLGTKDVGRVIGSTDGWLRILSCSTVYPLKRVDLILKSVIEVAKTRRVEWTHLGGGEDYDKIRVDAEAAVNENLMINMPGQMSYADVLEYYRTYPFDIFINLSTNEGIPVSIMEAASCDVPTVATNVGGTSEIVNKYTGLLVNENPTPKEVSDAILEVARNRNEYNPRLFWESTYVASKNYQQFAIFLSSLSGK